MTDYAKLLDEEIWAYIRKTDACYPPNVVSRSIQEQRDFYDAMCRVFYRGRPEGIETRDVKHGGVRCREYNKESPDQTVIYIHGGGFVVGGLDSHDDVCAEICDQTGMRVIAIDYRLSPEHKHPAAFDDCWSALSAISAHYSGGLVLAGDSGGGALAASVAHHARGRLGGRILGQVLIYPSLGGDIDKGSYLVHANAPHLTRDDILFYVDVRADGTTSTGDYTYAALNDSDYSNLPPTVLISAECDPLNDECGDYRDAIRAAGGQAIWIEESGLIYGYLRARSMSARAAASFDRIVQAITALGQWRWPY